MYNNTKREENYRLLAEQDYSLAQSLWLLRYIMAERQITLEEVRQEAHRGRTYTRAILDASPVAYGKGSRLEVDDKGRGLKAKAFRQWLGQGLFLFDAAVTQISDRRKADG